MHIQGINNELINREDYLWRYMDVHKLISFITSKSLMLSRFDRFEDTNEGISKNQLAKQYALNDSEYQHQIQQSKELQIDVRQKRIFASCWFSGTRESVAMWNLYASEGGVAVRIKVEDLLNAFVGENMNFENPDDIGSIYHGRVAYKNFFDYNDIEGFKDETRVIGFQKDLSFEHEKEYRFLVRQRYDDRDDDFLPYVKIGLHNFSTLRFELLSHPRMAAWQRENIQGLLNRFGASNFEFQESELRLR